MSQPTLWKGKDFLCWFDMEWPHILIFSKYKYLHVKIDSLANVKSCVTVGMFGPVQFQWITSQA